MCFPQVRFFILGSVGQILLFYFLPIFEVLNLEQVFLYCACSFLPQLGISLVYWLNLFKTHCVLFPGKCMAFPGKSIVYRVLSWSARETHFRPMRFPKPAPHAMCSTAQDAHIGIGQSCINNFLDFPILMQG